MGVVDVSEAPATPPGGRAHATDFDEGWIGADACGVCHAAEYADWLASPHAGAFEALAAAEQNDPRCLTCHSTGREPALRGVQCESCHGPGRDYWPGFVMRDRELAKALGMRKGGTIETCARCHQRDTPAIRPFHYKDALPLVNHGKARSS